MRATLSPETLLAGALVGGGLLMSLLTGMWVVNMGQLADNGVRTTIVDVGENTDGPLGWYRVGSQRTSCPGTFEVGEAVVYDPNAPGVCRAEAYLTWGTPMERLLMIGGVVLMLGGLVVFVHERLLDRDRVVVEEIAALDDAIRELDRDA